MKNSKKKQSYSDLPFIDGKRIFLRGLLESDLEEDYLNWLNDAEVCMGNSHHLFPYNESMGRSFILEKGSSSNELVLAIVLKKNNHHIGNIALQAIHHVNRSAEFSILIGEKECWGKGYASEAGQLICTHGFNTLNLHRISCGTYKNNIGMQKLAESLGMLSEGVRRKAVFSDGEYIDILEYGVLKDEFCS